MPSAWKIWISHLWLVVISQTYSYTRPRHFPYYHKNIFLDTSPLETRKDLICQPMFLEAGKRNCVSYNSGVHKSGLASNASWTSSGFFFKNILEADPRRTLATFAVMKVPKPICSSSTAASLNPSAEIGMVFFRVEICVATGPRVCKMAPMMLRLEGGVNVAGFDFWIG